MYWYKRALDLKKKERKSPNTKKKKKIAPKNARSKCLRYQIIKKVQRLRP